MENPSPRPSPTGEGVLAEGISDLAGKQRQVPPELLRRAKELRQNQTPAEKILWECLRDRRLGNAKFRRQHNIDRFIADFYCHASQLVIELDGSSHDHRQQEDQIRDEWFKNHGFQVLRFRNGEVFNDLPSVLQTITNHLFPISSQERG
ncbi:DUF559 domain-containing protein (plasmid) [Synechocystis sp. B12]|nr:DUF559 domain-containing protein [Synechocystis sp. B12]